MDFKTFANAFSTQWKQIGGDTSVMSIVREFPVFAPMFVIVCFFMFNMIILNIGLAFFVEVWIRVVHERKSSNRERTRDFLRLRKHISELDKVYISLRDILFSYWINSDRLSEDEIVRGVRAVVFEREAREFQSFLFITFLLCHSNDKNITCIAHSYRKNITQKSTLECKLNYDENLSRASRSNTGTETRDLAKELYSKVRCETCRVVES